MRTNNETMVCFFAVLAFALIAAACDVDDVPR